MNIHYFNRITATFIFFIFYFLPAILAVYFLAPKRHRNLVLFLGSLIFYAWGEPVYVALMLFSTAFNYFAGRKTVQRVQNIIRSGERIERSRSFD